MRAGASLPRIFGMNTTSLLHASRAALIPLIALSPLLWSHAAQAQTVNKCVVDGHVVYQSSACQNPAPAVTTVAVATSPSASASAPAKKKTLAELLRERDGAGSTAPAQRDAQGDGANKIGRAHV